MGVSILPYFESNLKDPSTNLSISLMEEELKLFERNPNLNSNSVKSGSKLWFVVMIVSQRGIRERIFYAFFS